MGVHCLKIFVFLALITTAYATPDSKLVVVRKDDEIILPPFLRDYDGGILNVISEHQSDHSNKRSAKPGEWLEYGDTLSTAEHLGVYVQLNEGLQWVGGGVFNAKLLGGKWKRNEPAYEILLNRGWMKVWSRPAPFSGALRIKTPKATIMVDEGVFWVSASDSKTEVYVLSGTVMQGMDVYTPEKYYEWSGNPSKLQKTSVQWDFVSFENRVASLYPNLVKLAYRANDDWLDDVSSKKYAELRAKGWQKADRYYPTPLKQ